MAEAAGRWRLKLADLMNWAVCGITKADYSCTPLLSSDDGTVDFNRLALFLLFAFGITRAACEFALTMAQLFCQFFGYKVDGRVELMTMILRVKIRARQSQVDLDNKRMLGFPLVVAYGHMGSDNIGIKVLQMTDFVGHVAVNGCCELDLTRADMNLHTIVTFHF